MITVTRLRVGIFTGDTVLLSEWREITTTVRSARRRLSGRDEILPARRQHHPRLQGEGGIHHREEDDPTESTRKFRCLISRPVISLFL